MITPEIYMRRTFEIEAVRVTEDNMDEVAQWCMGKKDTQTRPSKKGETGYTVTVPYLHIDVLRPLNERQEMAFVGDWVLKTGTSFKIYTDIAFNKNFVKKEALDVDVLDDESETEFMVLRNGSWEPMTPAELKEKLAPAIRETMRDMAREAAIEMYEKETELAGSILKENRPEPEGFSIGETPQVHLTHPKTPE